MSRALAPIAFLALAACAKQAGGAVAPAAPRFLLGLWHGFIFPVAWVLSLFMPDVAAFLAVGARDAHRPRHATGARVMRAAPSTFGIADTMRLAFARIQ